MNMLGIIIKNIRENLKLILAAIIGFFIMEAFLSLSALDKLNNVSFLESQIKEEDALASKSYSFKKFNTQQIQDIVKWTEESKKKEVQEKLEKELDSVIYFYLNKKRIEYFISAKLDENPEKSFCRLAVRTNGYFIETLNKTNILVKENFKEHKIDKAICNSLYGYGKPVM